MTVLKLVEAAPAPATPPHPASQECGYCDRTLPPWTVTDLRGWKPRQRGRAPYTFGPERLPSRPIGMYIEQRALRLRAPSWQWMTHDERIGEVCDLAGIKHYRNVWAWRHGDRLTVDFDVVDGILVNLGLNWWDIYSPERVRLPLVVARVCRMRPKKGGHSDKIYMSREITAEVWYGDGGPDLATLEIVRDAFEGEPRIPEGSDGLRKCKNGHPLTAANLRPRKGGRWACRACERKWQKASYDRRRRQEGKAA